MSLEEIKKLIENLGFPSAYDHFAEGTNPSLPYVLFRCPASNNFAADNKVYQKMDDLDIELYTKKKDKKAEEKIENLLDMHEFFYQKSERYIESEDIYETLYEMEMVVMG